MANKEELIEFEGVVTCVNTISAFWLATVWR